MRATTEDQTTNLKAFAAKIGVDSETLIDMLNDFPDLYFHLKRKRTPRFRTLIAADIQKLKILLPK